MKNITDFYIFYKNIEIENIINIEIIRPFFSNEPLLLIEYIDGNGKYEILEKPIKYFTFKEKA